MAAPLTELALVHSSAWKASLGGTEKFRDYAPFCAPRGSGEEKPAPPVLLYANFIRIIVLPRGKGTRRAIKVESGHNRYYHHLKV
jgi:hypothetical protein